MDMEKGEGLEIRKKYPVRAYPTLLFIDYDGTLVKRSVGAKPLEAFLALGESVLSSIDRTGPFVEQYEKGKRDPEFMYNYIKALNQSGKSSLKVANDYLRDQEDVTTPENLRIIFEAATEVDSRIFKMLMENREAVEELMPDVNMEEKIILAAENTLDKALEFDSEMLLNEAKKKVAEYDPDHEDAFAAKADMAFAKKQDDTNDYEKALKEYLKKGMEQDTPAATDRVASMALRSYPKEDGVVSLVLDILADNADRAGEAKYYLSHAIALAFSGDKQEAATIAERAFAMAKGKDAVTQMEARKLLDNLAND
jgi:tetratricopeptide (TPR) repeat protein